MDKFVVTPSWGIPVQGSSTVAVDLDKFTKMAILCIHCHAVNVFDATASRMRIVSGVCPTCGQQTPMVEGEKE